jgi:hypothetical protein
MLTDEIVNAKVQHDRVLVRFEVFAVAQPLDSRSSSPQTGPESVAFSTLRTASVFSSRSGTTLTTAEIQIFANTNVGDTSRP